MKDHRTINRSVRSVKPVRPVLVSGLGLGKDFDSLQRRQPKLFHLALREAEALALQTPFPLLVLPALVEEKLRAAARWQQRQDSIAQPRTESAFAV